MMGLAVDDSVRDRRSGAERRHGVGGEADALRMIVERMADGVLVVSRDGVIHFANPAAGLLFGRSVAELRGQPLGFPVLAGDSTEIDLLRPQRESVTVELRAADSEWEGRSASLVSLRDVTDRKYLELERLARARAEAASRAKSDFLALMSHELRTPLNAVIGFAELLLVDEVAPLAPAQRARVERIVTSGMHLRELVGEMLDLAEAEEGRLAVDRTHAPAGRPANGAIDDARSAADVAGVDLAKECAGDAGALFAGDERRVRQILWHLLDNAIKFTPPGGTVQIECGVAERIAAGSAATGDGPWIYWRVSDNGIGIAAEQRASIFEPFVQVDRGHTREKEGSGLGLTVSRSLARLMKGDITVESEPGLGSRFTLWLPAA
jgi:signal transduction histidine kinase